MIIRVCKKFKLLLSGKQKLRIVELVMLMVIGGIVETCSVALILPFMNAVLEPDAVMESKYIQVICDVLHIYSSRTFLVILAVFLAVIYWLKNLYLLFEMNTQQRFVYGNMFLMQRRMLECFFHRPYEYFLKINSGEVIRIIQSDTVATFGLLVALLTFFSELIVAGMLIIAVFIITPIVTFAVAVVLLVLVLLIYRVLNPIFRKAGKETQISTAGMNKWLLQSIQGIKEIKVSAKEEFFQKNYSYFGTRYINAIRRNRILELCPKFLIEAVSMSTMFMVVASLIYTGSNMETVIPILSAVAMAAMRLMPSVNRITACLSAIAHEEPMLDQLLENLSDVNGEKESCKPESVSHFNRNGKGMPARRFHDKIVFHKVTYHYPESEAYVLQGASMTIRKGEAIGIVGASGAGKTTAVDIIMGLLHPEEGGIYIDGISIQDGLHDWLQQIGYIPQMIFMLDGTIKENVAFGIDDNEVSEEQVWRALKEASLDGFVKTLPEGIRTEIGERGIRLSGGQRQRIGIARALYQNPEILVFDEATSALDHETEASIMESINSLQGQKTMIIIAHRLTTIENCDHIYRVEDMTIVCER